MQRIFALRDERGLDNTGLEGLGMSDELAGESMAAIGDLIARLEEGSSELLASDFYVPSGSEPSSGLKPMNREKSVPMSSMTEQSPRPGQPPATTPEVELPDVEMLEKPARPSQTVRSKAFGTEPVVQDAEAFAVADYLQLAGMSRRSVEFLVQGSRGERGRIVVAEGLVMMAEDELGSGVEAFGRLSMMTGAAVDCRPLRERPAERDVLGMQVDELLLEAARRRDEQQRRPSKSAMPPPLPPPLPGKDAVAGSAERDRTSSDPGRSNAVPAPPTSVYASTPPSAPASTPTSVRNGDVVTTVSVGVGAPQGAAVGQGAVNSGVRVVRPTPQRRQATAASAAKREVSVNAIGSANGGKPTKADNVLTAAPALSAAARAAADGSVLEVAGEMDAETTCAVVALAARQVEEVAGELGLGDLQSWHIGLGTSNWYVVTDPTEMLVVRGEAAKNPASVLHKIESGWRR